METSIVYEGFSSEAAKKEYIDNLKKNIKNRCIEVHDDKIYWVFFIEGEKKLIPIYSSIAGEQATMKEIENTGVKGDSND